MARVSRVSCDFAARPIHAAIEEAAPRPNGVIAIRLEFEPYTSSFRIFEMQESRDCRPCDIALSTCVCYSCAAFWESDTSMPELGKKYTCYSCHTKFYDLGKPIPKCPKCGADQRDAEDAPPVAASRSRRAAAVVEEPDEPELESDTPPASGEEEDDEIVETPEDREEEAEDEDDEEEY